MKAKFLLVALILVLSVGAVRADFSVIPQTTSIDCVVGQICPLNVTILNNNTYAIYNISLENSDIASFSPVASIAPGSTHTTQLLIKTDSNFNESRSFKFVYFYYANVTMNVTTTPVNMGNTAFTPNALSIVQGSTVVWTNQDSLVHKVKDVGGEFISSDLSPGSSYSKTFGDVKNYTVIDDYIRYSMSVKVLPRVQERLVHNSDYDKTISVFIDSNYADTEISALFLTGSLEVDWNGTEEAVVSLSNNGSSVAKAIKFDSTWMSFSKDSFDLAAGSSTFVIAYVSPQINLSSDTNKTYTKTITISSLNTPSLTLSLDVFVPYESQENIDKYKNTIPDGGSALLCPSGLYELREGMLYCVNSTIQYIYLNTSDPGVWVNMSAEQKDEIFASLGYLKADANTKSMYFNDQNETISGIDNRTATMEKRLENFIFDYGEDRATSNAVLFAIGALVILGIGGVVAYDIFKRKSEMQAGDF